MIFLVSNIHYIQLDNLILWNVSSKNLTEESKDIDQIERTIETTAIFWAVHSKNWINSVSIYYAEYIAKVLWVPKRWTLPSLSHLYSQTSAQLFEKVLTLLLWLITSSWTYQNSLSDIWPIGKFVYLACLHVISVTHAMDYILRMCLLEMIFFFSFSRIVESKCRSILFIKSIKKIPN